MYAETIDHLLVYCAKSTHFYTDTAIWAKGAKLNTDCIYNILLGVVQTYVV